MVLALTLVCGQLIAADQSKKIRTTGPQERPSAFVLGRVIDAVSRQPIGGARVSLGGRDGGRGQETVIANSAGYFLFRDLAAGSYTISATATGYLTGGLGQRVPGGRTQPLAVAAGERFGDIVVSLWKAASVSGIVTDERGDPVAGLAVSLLPRDAIVGGGSRSTGAVGLMTATTDASGAYQFSGLLAGDYIVSIASRTTQLPASFADADARTFDVLRATGNTALTSGLRSFGPAVRIGDALVQTSAEGQWGGSNSLAARLPFTRSAEGRLVGYAATFFPAATGPAEASPIALAMGEDRAGVNIRLRPIPLSAVSGRLTGPDGPLAGWSVHLFPAFAVNSILERSHGVGLTASSADGSFSFLGVAPGQYVVKAWRLPPSSVIGTDPLPAEATLWASVPISVAELPLTGLSITVQRGAAVRGRLVFEGAPAQLPPVRFQTLVSLAFEPSWSLAFGARLAARVNASFEFETQPIPPGRYAPLLPNNFTAPGWYFEAATRAGRDLMLSPLELEAGVDATDVVLLFSNRRTTLSGAVTDGAGRPASAAAVVAFPADFRTWISEGLPPLASFEAAATQAGTFAMDIRPGTYLVAAIDESRAATWRRDATIAALAAQATRVTIARGDNTVPALRLMPMKGPRP